MHFNLQASEEVMELHSTEAYYWLLLLLWLCDGNDDGGCDDDDKSLLFQTNYLEF